MSERDHEPDFHPSPGLMTGEHETVYGTQTRSAGLQPERHVVSSREAGGLILRLRPKQNEEEKKRDNQTRRSSSGQVCNVSHFIQDIQHEVWFYSNT